MNANVWHSEIDLTSGYRFPEALMPHSLLLQLHSLLGCSDYKGAKMDQSREI